MRRNYKLLIKLGLILVGGLFILTSFIVAFSGLMQATLIYFIIGVVCLSVGLFWGKSRREIIDDIMYAVNKWREGDRERVTRREYSHSKDRSPYDEGYGWKRGSLEAEEDFRGEFTPKSAFGIFDRRPPRKRKK